MTTKRFIAIALVILLAFSLSACGGDNSGSNDAVSTTTPASTETPEVKQPQTPAQEDISTPDPEEDEVDSNRAVWNGFSVALVDNWYLEDDGFQFINLKQQTDAFDKPDLLVRYLGPANNYNPAKFIEDEAAKEWVQELGEIQWADNVTVNGIEYLVAEYIGSRYNMFWLFAMPGTPDKDLDTDDSYLMFNFDWIDLATAMPLLETVEIDWSAAL
ncbi:MAG: hypothetical protein FWG21_05040 [Oscillospiraceae bacterium]|nr:hypothetical protein [Oscillospiraceae bacterium]